MLLKNRPHHNLNNRTVCNTKPVTVEYEVIEFAKTLEPIIDAIAKWGISYRSALQQKG
ncbi:hypothetical protein DVR12_22615 [Chitinophaga silvatica]|uniref:HTH hxlR-type domain-containing protein n=1 Tax=Chitinophaga silvatica TaxID=2282649 RepID=A0A3E1Y424_9BACT|nr:winged helix-turn-helix transcriptional regulator [Chitinophaga silvatica]RFS19431.1 hypothetical protein DVR12_22615 [Chitinophaga silvatica]